MAKIMHRSELFDVGSEIEAGPDATIQKFSFTLSPDCVHAPVDLLTLKP